MGFSEELLTSQHRHTRLLPRERSGPGDGPSRNVLASCWLKQSPALEVQAAGRLMRVLCSRHCLPLPSFSFPPNIYLRAVEAVRSLPSLPRHALIRSPALCRGFPGRGSARLLLEDGQQRPLGAPCRHGLSSGKAGEVQGSNSIMICMPSTLLRCAKQGSMEAGLCFPTGVCER